VLVGLAAVVLSALEADRGVLQVLVDELLHRCVRPRLTLLVDLV
jgi:hypothetical protein